MDENNISIYKGMIDIINKIEYAIKKQEEGRSEYVLMELSNKEFLSKCWETIEEGIREGYNKEKEILKLKDIHIEDITDEIVKFRARRMMVRGSYEEGYTKEELMDIFKLDEDEVAKMISEDRVLYEDKVRKGKEEKEAEIVLNMLSQGLNEEVISKLTKVDVEKIKEISVKHMN